MERFVWEETMDKRSRAHRQAMQSQLPGVITNYVAFLDALRSGKLDDRLNYAQSAASTKRPMNVILSRSEESPIIDQSDPGYRYPRCFASLNMTARFMRSVRSSPRNKPHTITGLLYRFG